MKKSQLLSFFVALALMLAINALPNIGGLVTTPSANNGVVAGTTTTSATETSQQGPSQQAPDSSDGKDHDGANVQTQPSQPDAKPDDVATLTQSDPGPPAAATISENGTYTSKEEVALYIHTYGHLPSNFISKTKARRAGWDSQEGNLDEVCPGMSIGGSTYYNEGWNGEELLPDAPGRTWKECDINYHGGYRGPERLVFSNDGLIFYTADHYRTFEQLY